MKIGLIDVDGHNSQTSHDGQTAHGFSSRWILQSSNLEKDFAARIICFENLRTFAKIIDYEQGTQRN